MTHRKIIAKLCEPNFSLAVVVAVVVAVAAAIWHALRVPNNICNYLFQFASIVHDAGVAVAIDSAVVCQTVEICAMNNTKFSHLPLRFVCFRASIKTCEKLLCAQDFSVFFCCCNFELLLSQLHVNAYPDGGTPDGGSYISFRDIAVAAAAPRATFAGN